MKNWLCQLATVVATLSYLGASSALADNPISSALTHAKDGVGRLGRTVNPGFEWNVGPVTLEIPVSSATLDPVFGTKLPKPKVLGVSATLVCYTKGLPYNIESGWTYHKHVAPVPAQFTETESPDVLRLSLGAAQVKGFSAYPLDGCAYQLSLRIQLPDGQVVDTYPTNLAALGDPLQAGWAKRAYDDHSLAAHVNAHFKRSPLRLNVACPRPFYAVVRKPFSEKWVENEGEFHGPDLMRCDASLSPAKPFRVHEPIEGKGLAYDDLPLEKALYDALGSGIDLPGFRCLQRAGKPSCEFYSTHWLEERAHPGDEPALTTKQSAAGTAEALFAAMKVPERAARSSVDGTVVGSYKAVIVNDPKAGFYGQLFCFKPNEAGKRLGYGNSACTHYAQATR